MTSLRRRALLHRELHWSVGLQERSDVADRERNLLRHVLPGIHAYLSVGREHRRLHRHRVGMGWDVVGQDEDRCRQARTKSRVTVNTKSALARYILARKA